MYTHVSRITTTTDQVFETVEAWIEYHGSIGENNELVADFAADLDEDGQTVIRTMIYDSVDNRLAHAALKPAADDVEYTVELVSESEET